MVTSNSCWHSLSLTRLTLPSARPLIRHGHVMEPLGSCSGWTGTQPQSLLGWRIVTCHFSPVPSQDLLSDPSHGKIAGFGLLHSCPSSLVTSSVSAAGLCFYPSFRFTGQGSNKCPCLWLSCSDGVSWYNQRVKTLPLIRLPTRHKSSQFWIIAMTLKGNHCVIDAKKFEDSSYK